MAEGDVIPQVEGAEPTPDGSPEVSTKNDSKPILRSSTRHGILDSPESISATPSNISQMSWDQTYDDQVFMPAPPPSHPKEFDLSCDTDMQKVYKYSEALEECDRRMTREARKRKKPRWQSRTKKWFKKKLNNKEGPNTKDDSADRDANGKVSRR